jgi:hypothetical protein
MGTGVQIENIAGNLRVCVCVCVWMVMVMVITKRDEELEEERLHIFICETFFCV